MIRINELLDFKDIQKELADMMTLQLDVEEITIAHLQGFYYRAKLRTSHGVAKFWAEFIANGINEAYDNGFVKNDRLQQFRIANPPMLSGDFRKTLEAMELSERRCLYFALLLNVDIEHIISLTWADTKTLIERGVVNDAAIDILDSLPRHFKFPYVFWKGEPPERLHDIKTTTQLTFGCTYDQLRKKFLSMVLIDSELDAEEFRKIRGIDHE